MARSSSTDAIEQAPPALSDAERERLLDLAQESIRRGLDGGRALRVRTDQLAPALQQRLGVFVTVNVAGELNGCIGSMVDPDPLGAAVPRLAWDAAFADPRLPVLRSKDYPATEIKISVLSPLEPLPPMTEVELIEALRPGVDGLLIRAHGRQATFLPAVWEKVPHPREFLAHLQMKAGLPPGWWPAGAEAFRYTSEEFGRPVTA
jgi:AmmeMemoRadiSam system protein A